MSENKMNKITLIIAVYNRVNLLRKSLIALKNQSVLPDEIIISDDGSTEDIVGGIKDIVEDFDFPIKIVHQENKGFRLARCRNNCVRESTGDFLIFFDQDVIHTTDYIKTFIENKKSKRFITAYPIRLTEEQSELITEESIQDLTYYKYLTEKQIKKVRKQYFKDLISFIGLKLSFVKNKPKLRGGFCAVNRDDYLKVNGYDEKFIGWGNEDDDFRRRLYKCGVTGYNPFFNQYPIHLYHETYHVDGERVNQSYSDSKKSEITEGNFRCEFGFDNQLDSDEVKVIVVNK